jgi:hypothetical protein
MTATDQQERLAQEASRYLAVVEAFARLDADPHARARARAHAACTRSREDQAATLPSPKEVRGWRH